MLSLFFIDGLSKGDCEHNNTAIGLERETERQTDTDRYTHTHTHRGKRASLTFSHGYQVSDETYCL